MLQENNATPQERREGKTWLSGSGANYQSSCIIINTTLVCVLKNRIRVVFLRVETFASK